MITAKKDCIGRAGLHGHDGGFSSEPLSPRQRSVFSIGEDSPSAKSSRSLEATSLNLLQGDWCQKGEKCEGQGNCTPAPEQEDGLHSNEVAAEENEDTVTRVKSSEELLDEPDLPALARRESILIRVLSHWKRTVRKDSQGSTRSES